MYQMETKHIISLSTIIAEMKIILILKAIEIVL